MPTTQLQALNPTKLSDSEIAEVVRRAHGGEHKTQLAKEYGVSRETLYKYLRRHEEVTDGQSE